MKRCKYPGCPYLTEVGDYCRKHRTHVDYHEYMQSNEWQAFSQKWRRKVGKCESCGGEHLLCIHHHSYKNLGRETRKDIAVWCTPCHTIFHSKVFYDSDSHTFKKRTSLKALA